MIDKVSKFIDNYKLLGKTIIVGFSGGYDSLCLLDIMRKLAPVKNIKLIAAHYNHNWRGDVSKKEQENCENYCKQYGIEFYTETAPFYDKKTEANARELRYGFFEKVILKYEADGLFTAHNYDDNAETVLYRIIKGTGITGLRGILPVRDKFYRPLLGIKRTDIEKYCDDNNLIPNIDESNNDVKYNRNFIRHEILPILSKINPEIKKALNNLSSAANSESRIIDEYMGQVREKLYENNKFNSEFYKSCSDDIRMRIIFEYLRENDIDYDMQTVCDICKFIKETLDKNSPAKYSLGKDKFLYVNPSVMEIVTKYDKSNEVIKIEESGIYKIGDAEFRMEECYKNGQSQDETVAYVDLSEVFDLTLRTRRDGDFISPLGLGGKKKLKEYLIDRKIPEPVRDKLVLLCEGKEVLWVAGVGLSERIKIKTEPTHKICVKYNIKQLLDKLKRGMDSTPDV